MGTTRVPVWLITSAVSLLATGLPATGWAAADDDHYGIEPVRFINERIAAAWVDAEVTPVASATDGEWCRRVHLDLIGRIPTLVELQRFLTDSSPTKKADLVARLLGEDYEDDYARRWTDVWTTILIGRDTTNELVNRAGMRQWLRRALSKNLPYDRFMEELVTATGVNANRDGVEGFNGATNFLSGKMSDMGVEDGVQATAKTAQIFLGVQVQCTQCHNHPFNKGKQNQFWEMNAFFRQTRALRQYAGTEDVQFVELADEDFAGQGGNPTEAEVFYELRNGLMKTAFPVFLDGTEISKQGWLPGAMEDGTPYGVHRRRELVGLIKRSPLFPRALVNRMWGQLLGYGFTKPVDDLGEHNPPSHPELLDGLAERFEAQSFDLKELLRWITLSKPYSLSSRGVNRSSADDPSLGDTPKFARFYLRQMEAEQLYDSLLTATQADKTAAGEEAARNKDEWMQQFVTAFGTDEGDESTTFNGSITQVLMMFNGELIRKATGKDAGSFLHRVAETRSKNDAKIRELYLAALARVPTTKELAMANGMLVARKGGVSGVLQDVWWAVLNSNEFIINH
jgi:hypothetical protein